MTPAVGHVLQFHLAGLGWRPLLVTSTENIGGAARVSGWVKLDPADPRPIRNPFPIYDEPVVSAQEGEAFGCWRWPPTS